MPGWAELPSYSALIALTCGVLTAFSFWGVGRLACGRCLGGLHGSVRLPVECVGGVIVTSLVVQAFAMAQTSRAGPMRAIWIAGALASAGALTVAWRRRPRTSAPPLHRAALLAWLPAGVLGVALLLAAVAPETRSDELSYHALASARLLSEGGLRFHPLPWEASIATQLIWHYALVPLYAMAGGAGAGVTSACLALLLALSTARLVAWRSGSGALAAAAAFLALAGGYVLVFFSTTGPHAFGYLAVFAAVAVVAWSHELRRDASPAGYVLAVGVACAGALASKVTLLPLTALLVALAAADVVREIRAPGQRAVPFAVLALVPLITLAPLAIWSLSTSGSPLGVLTPNLAHPPFDAQTLAAYEGTRELFANRFQWRFESAYWSLPMVLCGLAALALESSRARRRRWWLIAALQVLVILLLLPKELRHLGGIQYPLMAGGLIAVAERWRARGRRPETLALLAGAPAAPWGLLVLWIASIYLPLALGRESAVQFVRRYAGLEADYEALERRLPPDAILLIGRSRSDAQQYGWYARAPIWYAPRPVRFDTAEGRGCSHVYLMYVGEGAEGSHGPVPLDPWLPEGCTLGASIYVNPQARFYPSRTPGGAPGLARLEVFALRAAP